MLQPDSGKHVGNQPAKSVESGESDKSRKWLNRAFYRRNPGRPLGNEAGALLTVLQVLHPLKREMAKRCCLQAKSRKRIGNKLLKVSEVSDLGKRKNGLTARVTGHIGSRG